MAKTPDLSREPAVLPVASRALLDACAALGADPDEILRDAGLGRGDLEQADKRIPAAAADAIWQAAFTKTGDASLAVRAAEVTPFGAFRALDYLAASGLTVGEGLRRVATYFPIIDPRGALEIEETRASVTVQFRSVVGAPLPPPAQEYTLAMLLLRSRHTASLEWQPGEVRFTFPRPRDARAHQRVYGPALVFDAEEAALVLPRQAFETPTRAPDRALFVLLDQHAQRLLAEVPAESELLRRTRLAIAQALPGRGPDLEQIARQVSLSRRSLQRRLEEAGTSFAELVERVRRERAEAYLATPSVSIAEVSYLLGFSEQSVFTRAFKRWTGRSPTEFRARPGRASTEAR